MNNLFYIVISKNGKTHKLDCGTFYYLNTNDVVGAKIPILPVALYRHNYQETRPYFPSTESSPGVNSSQLSEKISAIESQMDQVREKQKEISEKTSLMQEAIDRQDDEISGIKSILSKILDFLKNIFSFNK